MYVPVIEGLPVKVTVAVPVLVKVTVCEADAVLIAVDGKMRLLGVMLTETVVAAAPVPLNVTVCGELAALSAKLSEAVNAPVAAGLNVTVTEQEALTASADPQVLVCENEVALVPVMLTPVTVMVAVPELVSVTVCVADEELTAVEEKVRCWPTKWLSAPATSKLPASRSPHWRR